ncbi:hypothetical protein ROHU_024646 [Labeo rohita]|uniref:Uncharacterized protein n=1 Tax=Labeo rohita TaxID=84645 RepID=A0A498MNJ0_LABRO|nr:hypothetical protein ROHU_024646 [Labeo rohita]
MSEGGSVKSKSNGEKRFGMTGQLVKTSFKTSKFRKIMFHPQMGGIKHEQRQGRDPSQMWTGSRGKRPAGAQMHIHATCAPFLLLPSTVPPQVTHRASEGRLETPYHMVHRNHSPKTVSSDMSLTFLFAVLQESERFMGCINSCGVTITGAAPKFLESKLNKA